MNSSILLTLLMLGIIIMIHELGHFLAARMFKIPVSEFALGMGPKLITYHGKETDYAIRAIPMGGFVNIEGMEIDSTQKNGFNAKKPWQRFIVLFAGVFMNFILAFFIVLMSNFLQGNSQISDKAVIGEVIKGTNAEKTLIAGDKIIEIEGIKVSKWNEISQVIKSSDKKEISVKILRNEKEIDEKIKLTYLEKEKMYIIGIRPSIITKKYGLVEGFKVSLIDYKNLFKAIIDGFKMLFTGKVKMNDMTGTVGLVQVVSDVGQNSLGFVIWLTALLSINVGLFNLLPFPALDGGRIIFVLLEMIGIKINKKIEEKLHLVGIVILVALFILITFNDIRKFF